MTAFPTLHFSIQNTLHFYLLTEPTEHPTNAAADGTDLWSEAKFFLLNCLCSTTDLIPRGNPLQQVWERLSEGQLKIS